MFTIGYDLCGLFVVKLLWICGFVWWRCFCLNCVVFLWLVVIIRFGVVYLLLVFVASCGLLVVVVGWLRMFWCLPFDVFVAVMFWYLVVGLVANCLLHCWLCGCCLFASLWVLGDFGYGWFTVNSVAYPRSLICGFVLCLFV